MNFILYIVIGLSAGYLAAYHQAQRDWMIVVYMGLGVVASMVAGGLLSLALDLLKTLLLLIAAAVLVVLVTQALPDYAPLPLRPSLQPARP